jgi:hypothetical protein
MCPLYNCGTAAAADTIDGDDDEVVAGGKCKDVNGALGDEARELDAV